MKILGCLAVLCTGVVWAQAPPAVLPALSDDAAIATFEDGAVLTAGQLRGYLTVLDPAKQAVAARSPETLIEEIAFMRKLSAMAEKEKLDQQSPAREQLAFNRMLFLTQIKAGDALNRTQVDQKEVLDFYNANQNQYKQVRVQAIYIAFDGKGLSEDKAKTKAAVLLSELRAGADFAKLAKDSSDDETSRGRDGYFATLNPADNIPDAFRVVFDLKQGEISEPVRQENGYYLLKAEKVAVRPLAQLSDQISSDLKQQHFKSWMDRLHGETKVRYPNPAFQPK